MLENTANNSSTYNNTALADSVLTFSIFGGGNTGVGSYSMTNIGDGNANTAVGYLAMKGKKLNDQLVFGSKNTALGSEALMNLIYNPSTTFTNENTSVGFRSARLLELGYKNTSVGSYSLEYNLNGFHNTAIGYEAQNLSKGSSNTSLGFRAMKALENGNENIAIGINLMIFSKNGTSNLAIGVGAMSSLNSNNEAGTYNLALGTAAMLGTLGGNFNVCIGTNSVTPLSTSPFNNFSTGDHQLSIQNCIWGINMSNQTNARLGIGVVSFATTVTSIVAIGTIAKLHVGGTLRIDNVPNIVSPAPANKYLYVDVNGFVAQATLPAAVGGVTSTCNSLNFVPKGNASGNLLCSQIFDDGESVGINQTSNFNYAGGPAGGIIIPAVGTRFKLAVNGYTSSISYVALSDKRLKKDIKTIPNPLDKIAKLGGYTYKWIENNSSGLELGKLDQAGFIAQEVLEVLPEAVIKREDGTLGLIYDAIMPLLAEGIKAQQKIIIDLQKLTIDQQSDLEKLKNEIQNLSDNSISLRSNNVNDNSVNLLNVSPNPIVGTSTISYTLKNIKAQSLIIVTDLQGKLIKKINLAQNLDKGTIEVSMLEFPSSGMYLFSLLSNNEEVQTKKIFVNK